MATYLYELAQDAAYQSYTSCLTELWPLSKQAQGLNTYNNNNNNNNNVYVSFSSQLCFIVRSNNNLSATINIVQVF